MRTTVTIDDGLLRRAKEQAAASGRSLSEIVEEALRASFARPSASAEPFRLALVTAGSGGVRAGLDLSDNAAVRDVIDGLV